MAGIARLWLTLVLALVASGGTPRAQAGPVPDATRLELERADRVASNEAIQAAIRSMRGR